MLGWSLAFLIVAVLTALLGFGEDASLTPWLAEAFFVISLALFLASLISHCKRRDHEMAGRRPGP